MCVCVSECDRAIYHGYGTFLIIISYVCLENFLVHETVNVCLCYFTIFTDFFSLNRIVWHFLLLLLHFLDCSLLLLRLTRSTSCYREICFPCAIIYTIRRCEKKPRINTQNSFVERSNVCFGVNMFVRACVYAR